MLLINKNLHREMLDNVIGECVALIINIKPSLDGIPARYGNSQNQKTIAFVYLMFDT